MNSARRKKSPKAPAPSPIQNWKWFACLLIPVLVLGVYGSFVNGPFLYDDPAHILQNRTVTSFKSLFDVSSLKALFLTPYGLSNRPFLYLTYGLNYHASGASPAAFRITNILIHFINTMLLFLLTWRIAQTAKRTSSEVFWCSLTAGCIFAVHPLLTESVTYIAGRSATLCATFYLAGLLATIEAGARTRRQWVPLTGVLICFIVGMLIKQDAAMLPLAAIALVWLVWPDTQTFRRRLVATVALVLVQIAILAVFQTSLKAVADVALENSGLVRGGSEPTLTFVPYMLTSIKEWVFYYLWRLFVPLHLSVDPASTPVVTPTALVVIAAGVIIALVALGYVVARRDRLLGASFVLILVSPLAAYCVFPLADVVAEHRAYLAVAGAAMLMSVLCSRMYQRQILLFVLIAAYFWLAVSRNSVWMDPITLWEDASRKAPEKLRPHLNLGIEYEGRGRNDLAISHYKFVLARNGDYLAARTNLAALYLAQNDTDSAEQLLDPVVQRNVPFAPVYVNLAAVRIQQRKFESALALLGRAEEINPRQSQVAFTRGVAYSNMERPDLAIREYLRELDFNPGFIAAQLELARAYETTGEREKATSYYQKVVAADPSNAQALSGLVRILENKLSK